jgi:hypothetical protein
MLKYIAKLITRLTSLKHGVVANDTVWTGQAESATTIDAQIAQLVEAQDKISTIEDQLAQKKQAAHLLEQQISLVADTIENKAIGFHTATPEKLADYDIKLRKAPEPKPIPGVIHAIDIKDDYDGMGFILSTQVDPVADKYEWEKGAAANPLDLNTLPVMKLFKVTSKTTFVDDEVTPGVRYFYRVRGSNASGSGIWSGPVSRVQ